MAISLIRRIFSKRTIKYIEFDLLRFKARHFGSRSKIMHDKLHLGCWNRKVSGWLNVDVKNSDYDMDLGCGILPLPTNHFKFIVSQQVIEHLELFDELIPLFKECYRVLREGGEIWLSCPDMERVCGDYIKDKGVALIEDKKTRVPGYYSFVQAPPQHAINELFHQDGEHKNLFDFELLEWTLKRAGFTVVKKANESLLLQRFPEFPQRLDDYQALYVCAIKTK